MLASYPEPFRAFRFLVEVENNGVIAAAFSQFSGVKIDVQSVPGRTGDEPRGVQSGVRVFTSFAPVTLTKGVVGDSEFLEWLFASVSGVHSGPNGKNMNRTLNVVALDEFGRRGIVWTLYGASPIGYELTPMDGGRSELLSESLTFSVSAVERKTETHE